jgi:hypothetical protein
MLVLLHGLLLSLVVSEVSIHAYRVSQVKRKITKLFYGFLKKKILLSLESATVVGRQITSGLDPLPSLWATVFRVSSRENRVILLPGFAVSTRLCFRFWSPKLCFPSLENKRCIALF